jgi:hypothetical protein
MAAQVNGSGRVLAGRQINRASPGFGASIHSLLDGRLGVLGFAACGAVVLHVEYCDIPFRSQEWRGKRH